MLGLEFDGDSDSFKRTYGSSDDKNKAISFLSFPIPISKLKHNRI